MKKNTTIFITAVVVWAGASIAMAAPIADKSLIHILQFDYVNPSFSSSSTNSYYSNTYASSADAQAYGDLTTGKIGTRVIGSEGRDTNSIATIFDTLTFNTGNTSPVEVSFDLNHEGSLASSTADMPGSMSYVRIYDITGLDTWLETRNPFGLWDSVDAVDEATSVTWARVGTFGMQDVPNFEFPHDGLFYDFDSTANGSFMADPLRTYGIAIGGYSIATSNSAADFLGTSTFQFTNLNGAALSSGSGVFLSQQSVSVPEPSILLLLSIGAIGMIGLRRKSGKTDSIPA